MAAEPIDEYEERNRRDKRIQGMLSDYDDELDDLDKQIAETKDLQRAIGEKLANLEARRSDLQLQRADRHGDLQMSSDMTRDFPTIARIEDLGR